MKSKLISVKDFTPEELRKWQLKLLDILVYFRDFCQKNNLRFYLSAGTCLGAVRHHGFIPWDDDLDVVMPRPDYDKLQELWNKNADTSRYECCFTTKEKCIRFPMTVIRSNDTTCIYDHSVNDDINQGLKIDVEFLDGVPEDKFTRKFNQNCARVRSLLMTGRTPRRKELKWKIGSQLVLWLFPTNKIRYIVAKWCEKKMKRYKFDSDVKYVRYSVSKPILRETFSETIYVDFEGYQMPIPKGYENLLSTWYGDWTKLPPEECRVPATDNLVFYDLDKGYQEYKGLKYCVRK